MNAKAAPLQAMGINRPFPGATPSGSTAHSRQMNQCLLTIVKPGIFPPWLGLLVNRFCLTRQRRERSKPSNHTPLLLSESGFHQQQFADVLRREETNQSPGVIQDRQCGHSSLSDEVQSPV